jgi:hypothetical protein
MTSTTINIHPSDHRPTFDLLGEDTHRFAVVDLGAGAQVLTSDTTILAAYADAFLAAAQALEAEAEERAATAVNEANATTDAQPFGTVPTAAPLEPISVTA